MKLDALNKWLQFEEEILHANRWDEWVVVWEESATNLAGTFTSLDWRRETRAARSALIQRDQHLDAVQSFVYNELECETALYDGPPPYFRFGDSQTIRGIPVKALTFSRRDVRTGRRIIELRLEFVRYHNLVYQDQDLLVHPTEDHPAVRFERRSEDKEIERVRIYRDSLRDYLAASDAELVISSCVDRFANTRSRDDLAFGCVRKEVIQPSLMRDLEPRSASEHHLAGARCILWSTKVLPPLDALKVERNPWHIGSIVPPETGLRFRVDADGTLCTYEESSPTTFLFFDRKVLQRYLDTEGFEAGLHQRYWGGVGWKDNYSIPVGINAEGLVTVLFGDIAEIPREHQAHWVSFNKNPLGDPCEEQFAAQMMCDPVKSHSLRHEFERRRERLSAAFTGHFGSPLYRSALPDDRDLHAVSIGPVRDTRDSFCASMHILHQWLVESMNIDAPLRANIRETVPCLRLV